MNQKNKEEKMDINQEEYCTIWLTQDECAFDTTAREYFGPKARMGRWHEKPNEDEVQIGSLKVRHSDPGFPVFIPKV